jgi:hypothetical protein
MDIKIRFNNTFPEKSDKKWRIIVDGIEHLVDEIEIKCKSFTSSDEIEIAGQFVLKHHITCNSKNVSFVTKKNQFKAIVL